MPEQSQNTERTARWLRLGADGLCYARIAAAPILAGYIIAKPNYKSVKLAATVGALYGTDKLDGLMARHAAELLGEETSRASAELDQKSDKILTHALYGAVIVREYLNGQRGYAKALAVNSTIDVARNIAVNRTRKNAPEGVRVEARPSGKQKQLLFVLGAVAATSPLPESAVGQEVVTGLVDAATVLSISSGAETIHSIQQQTDQLTQVA